MLQTLSVSGDTVSMLLSVSYITMVYEKIRYSARSHWRWESNKKYYPGLINGEEGMHRAYTLLHGKTQTSWQGMLNLDSVHCVC